MPDTTKPTTSSGNTPTGTPHTWQIGCVSFLNARPLIEGLQAHAHVQVYGSVPSKLLQKLLAGVYDVALCPVIDYFQSDTPLTLLPASGIGCDGPTLTVRLFSRCPLEQIRTVHADIDSHTSVALMRILLWEQFRLEPKVVAFDTHMLQNTHQQAIPETLLLIGDKVITHAPSSELYPYQMDLGEAWKQCTGLPFVFATWMTPLPPDHVALATLGQTLLQTCTTNLQPGNIARIAANAAISHGWPGPLALEYMSKILRYTIDARAMQAIQLFGEKAAQRGLCQPPPPIQRVVHNLSANTGTSAPPKSRSI